MSDPIIRFSAMVEHLPPEKLTDLALRVLFLAQRSDADLDAETKWHSVVGYAICIGLLNPTPMQLRLVADVGTGDERLVLWQREDGYRMIETNADPIYEDDDGMRPLWDAVTELGATGWSDAWRRAEGGAS